MAPEFQAAVVAALAQVGLINPQHLAGTADTASGELAGKLSIAKDGLLKRTFRCAEVVSAAKRAKTSAIASSQLFDASQSSQVPSALAAGSLISLLGLEASAGAVASALTAGSVVVDFNDKVEKAAVRDLPYHLRPHPALFQLLVAADKSAQEAVPARKAYTYVDQTHKGVFPCWMGSEAVGGHTLMPSDFDGDPNADIASLGAMGGAFKGALETAWRSPGTTAAWYSGVQSGAGTVATGQMTWPMVLVQADQMHKLEEKERIPGNLPGQSIASRAEWGDPTFFDLVATFSDVDMQVFETTKTRLLQTGLSRRQKLGRGAERIMSKAAQAAKALAKQQVHLEASTGAMSRSGGKGGGKGGGKERAGKHNRRETFSSNGQRQIIGNKKDEGSQRWGW
ncbi:unnamed protein product [Prorocentrum cordatum]|uniref:Uncharacterized protein n=1 Tax=Prorocentrum cordatum TaxID=2364126 RepID=A0ABN9XY58_9DINO|nr:unnamed protein product [Polarella glacialis]